MTIDQKKSFGTGSGINSPTSKKKGKEPGFEQVLNTLVDIGDEAINKAFESAQDMARYLQEEGSNLPEVTRSDSAL